MIKVIVTLKLVIGNVLEKIIVREDPINIQKMMKIGKKNYNIGDTVKFDLFYFFFLTGN